MKIREIEAVPVQVPRLQIDAAHATFTFSKFTIVFVRTDNGMEGLPARISSAPIWRPP
jgi:L-alanine-DL-glutamate epimerase-like enolase superfamily enzyme